MFIKIFLYSMYEERLKNKMVTSAVSWQAGLEQGAEKPGCLNQWGLHKKPFMVDSNYLYTYYMYM